MSVVAPAHGRDVRGVRALLEAAADGERVALARLVSIAERGDAQSRELAGLAYATAPPYSLGVTGAPGAGKSTLTDQLLRVAAAGWSKQRTTEPGDGATAAPTEAVGQMAVLAVDPSSPFSGGAILGDRVRMQDHAMDPTVFIRSMATRGHLGGLALAVPDTLRIMGAARFGLVLVETVGVGQMEVEVASATDTVVVVVTPGWGDSMQASKAGILEVADLFVVNKADRPGAREARRDLEQMLDLAPESGWRPPVVETTASSGEGVEELWVAISGHRAYQLETGRIVDRRRERLADELRRVLASRALDSVRSLARDPAFAHALGALEAGETDPYSAADSLVGALAGALGR